MARGDGELSLRDVARAAGVSPAAPYRHFRDREALLDAVAQDIAGELLADVRGEASLVGAVNAYLTFAAQRRAEFRLCSGRCQASNNALAPVWDHLRRVWESDGSSRSSWGSAHALIHGAATLVADGHAPCDLGDTLRRLR